jgi:hypothetical protein
MGILSHNSNGRLALLVVLAFVGVLAWCTRGHGAGTPYLSNSSQQVAAGPATAKSARQFVQLLQRALRTGDRAWILSVTRFPVRVGENETGRVDLDETALARDFDKVWNPQTVKAVLDEDLEHVDWAPGGFVKGIGCGEVWLTKMKDGQFRIAEFNVSAYRIAGMSIQDCYQVRAFLAKLQAAIASNSRDQVTSMIRYPLRYHGESKTIILHNSTEAMHDYDLLFSAKLRQAITEQKYWKLIGQAEGIGIEGGFVWISDPAQNGAFKITSIFAPP